MFVDVVLALLGIIMFFNKGIKDVFDNLKSLHAIHSTGIDLIKTSIPEKE